LLNFGFNSLRVRLDLSPNFGVNLLSGFGGEMENKKEKDRKKVRKKTKQLA